MKKYLLIFVSIFYATLFTGCSEDEFTPPTYITFADASASTAVPQNGSSTYEVTVYVNNVTGSARTFDLNVQATSSLNEDSYNVPASVTIPANENEGTFVIELADTSISNAGDNLELQLASGENYFVGESFNLDVTRDCPSSLEGTYSVVTNGQSTDGEASAPVVDLPYTVTVTKTGSNTYSVSDIFAGIYIEWYCGPYGYCVETPGSFTDVCGNLSSSFTEPYGTTANLSGTANADGTLTISFQNGYGDEATSVYTKI